VTGDQTKWPAKKC